MSSTNGDLKAVGDRLGLARAAQTLTQAEFAAALGLSLRGYQNYERGERAPSDDLIRAAWSTFGIDPVWLLTGAGSMTRAPCPCPKDAGTQPAAGGGAALPPELAGMERRIGAFLALLGQLAPDHRDAILSDALSRAEAAQQLAELRQAVGELAAKQRA